MLRTRQSPKLVAALLAAMGVATVAPVSAAEAGDCPNHGVLLDAAALCAVPQTVAMRTDTAPLLRARATERGVRMSVPDTAAVAGETGRRRTDPASDDASTARSAPQPRSAAREGDR